MMYLVSEVTRHIFLKYKQKETPPYIYIFFPIYTLIIWNDEILMFLSNMGMFM